MRRLLGLVVAVVALSATMVFLPVYSAPTPEVQPVAPDIQAIELGSFGAPAAGASTDPDATVQEAPTETAPGAPAPRDDEPVSGSTAAGSTAPGSTAPEPPGGTTSSDIPAPTSPGTGPVPTLSLSRPDTGEFSTLGVTWAADHEVTGVLVRVRTRDSDGEWSGWTDLEVEDPFGAEGTGAGESARHGTAPYFTGAARGVEVVVTASGATTPADLSLQLIDPGTSPADAFLGAPEVTDEADAAAAMPAIYSRKQWGADESLRHWDPEYSPTLKAAAIHHTAGSNSYTAADVPGILRGIYAYHATGRGWGDIGYNVLVDKFGRAWEGRYSGERGISSPVIGAHTGGFNGYTFGVAMMGDYEKAQTTDAMVQTVAAVVAWKLSLYNVNPTGVTSLTSSGGGTARYAKGTTVSKPTVFGHRDVGSTDCPGQYGYAQMQTIRDGAARRIAEAAVHDPRGSLDRVSLTAAGFEVGGWAFDPDAPSSTSSVSVEVDGNRVATVAADQSRPDVGRVHPDAGDDHGFSHAGTLTNGDHAICVYTENLAGPGSRNQLGCSEVTFTNEAPRYSVDGVTEQADGTVRIRGWAFDPDGTPVRLHVYDNGKGSSHGTSVARPDVAGAFPDAGPNSGFDVVLGPLSGSRRICLFVIDTVAPGNTVTTGCRELAYRAPIGSLESVTETASGGLQIRGWAFDPSLPRTGSRVHVYVDGRGVSIAASGSRPDVATAHPEAGAAHGFDTTVAAAPGERRACAYAVNLGLTGPPVLLGCRSVTLAYVAPTGVVDDVRAVGGGQVRIRGWMLDRSLPTTPVQVHVYVDGRGAAQAVADRPRADIARAFPGVGELHGLDTTLTLTPGPHSVCVFAINLGVAGPHRLLRCVTVTVT